MSPPTVQGSSRSFILFFLYFSSFVCSSHIWGKMHFLLLSLSRSSLMTMPFEIEFSPASDTVPSKQLPSPRLGESRTHFCFHFLSVIPS